MDQFQLPLASELELDGIFDLGQPISDCSAQAIMAALMLRQRNPILVQEVLADLSECRDGWKSFVAGPALPKTDAEADPGNLTCLRDLWMGWNTNTLHILARNADTARSLKALAEAWDCSEITIHPPKRTKRLVGMTRHSLVSISWEQPTLRREETDFEETYEQFTSPTLFDSLLRLGKCSPQKLMAGLLLRTDAADFPASTILQDLQAQFQWWRSFIVGSPLPNSKMGLSNSLSVLQKLPSCWCNDCLYIWARNNEAALHLKALGQTWSCEAIVTLEGVDAARLLALPDAPPIVVMSW